MSKINLANVISGYHLSVVNANFQAIADALNNSVLFRNNPSGTPNSMSSPLDMNGQLILNAANAVQVTGFTWEGPWTTLRAYDVGDIVENNGSAYFCIVAHIAGVFTTDLAAVRWQLFATAGGLPSQIGQANKFLQTNGASLLWTDVPTAPPPPPDLTVPGGSSLVGHIASGTGAVPRTVSGKLRESVSVLDFIPVAEHATIRLGTNTFDCRPGIQAAIDSLGIRGGTVFIPRGTYEMSDFANRCLLLTSPIILAGEGYFSVLKPKSTVNVLTNAIQFAPNPAIDCSQSIIKNLFIGTVDNGLRFGNYGIFLDTQVVGANLPELKITDVFIGLGLGAAIAHLNTPANNANGGLYGSTISECQLRGGINLQSSGDSINIENNIISGAFVGIYASMVDGASQLAILSNNITSAGGAIQIAAGRRVQIHGNNIEQTVAIAAANGSSMINLTGANGIVSQVSIKNNNLGAFSGTGVVFSIRVQNCISGSIEDNSFLPSSNSQWAGTLFVGCAHMRIGWNQYGTGSLNRWQDGGVGTMGVVRTFTPLLQNGWVEFLNNFSDPFYIKDAEGYVTITGTIKNGTIGTIAAPVVLFNLPVDYRPAKSEYFLAYSQNSVPAMVQGSLLVSAGSGNVITTGGANEQFSISLRYLAANPQTYDIRPVGYGAGNISDV